MVWPVNATIIFPMHCDLQRSTRMYEYVCTYTTFAPFVSLSWFFVMHSSHHNTTRGRRHMRSCAVQAISAAQYSSSCPPHSSVRLEARPRLVLSPGAVNAPVSSRESGRLLMERGCVGTMYWLMMTSGCRAVSPYVNPTYTVRIRQSWNGLIHSWPLTVAQNQKTKHFNEYSCLL